MKSGNSIFLRRDGMSEEVETLGDFLSTFQPFLQQLHVLCHQKNSPPGADPETWTGQGGSQNRKLHETIDYPW